MDKQTTMFYTKVETYKWYTKVGAVEPLESGSPDLVDEGKVGEIEFRSATPLQGLNFASIIAGEMSEHTAKDLGYDVALDDIKVVEPNVYQADYPVGKGWVVHVKTYITTLEYVNDIQYDEFNDIFGGGK